MSGAGESGEWGAMLAQSNRLRGVTIARRDSASLAAVAEHPRAGGWKFTDRDGVLAVRGPLGNRLSLAVKPSREQTTRQPPHSKSGVRGLRLCRHEELGGVLACMRIFQIAGQQSNGRFNITDACHLVDRVNVAGGHR